MEKGEKIPGFSSEDKRGDYLQDFRDEKSTHEGLLDTQKEYLVDEEELETKPNHNEWVDVENLQENESLSNFVKSFDLEIKEDEDHLGLGSFLNEDLSKNWKQIKPQKEVRETLPGNFSMEEFNTMENCARFKELAEKSTLFDKRRPSYSNGEPLTDEDISKEAIAYQNTKEKNDWKNYSPFEIDFMKNCASWDYFYRKIKNNQSYPLDQEGIPQSKESIAEMAKKYADFEKNDPETFAKYKVENGEWIYSNFNWKEKKYNERTQYHCFKKTEDPETKKIITIKYIIEPSKTTDKEIILDNTRKSHYFRVKKEIKPSDDLLIRIIDLKRK